MTDSTTSPASDALTVARWCWPEWTWARDPADGVVRAETPAGITLYMDFWEERDNACAAEHILIERGLAEEYGAKLWNELGLDVFDLDLGRVREADVATIATIPLDARVRAMAAVIRAQEEAKR